MSEPQIVEQAKHRPGKCLVSRDTEGPFVDTGCWAREHDPYLYLSVRWVEEVGTKLLGMVSHEKYMAEFEELKALVKEQEERLAALTRFEDAVAEFSEAKEAVAK